MKEIRGLFPRALTVEDLAPELVEHLRSSFGIDALFLPRPLVALHVMAVDAKASLSSDHDGNRTLAHEVDQHVKEAIERRTAGDSDAAIHHAIMATQRWVQLRANIKFEAAVKEKENRRRRASALSDADIQRAIDTHSTRVFAAAHLGISDRQLRNRINRMRKS